MFLSSSFFLGGLSLVVLILVIMVPVVVVVFPHSSASFFSLSLFFGVFAFSSFLWLLDWVSTFLLTSVGNFVFLLLLLLLLLWLLSVFLIVSSVVLLCIFFLLLSLFVFFFLFFNFWFFLLFVVHLWCCCFESTVSSFDLFFSVLDLSSFCFNCCCICGVRCCIFLLLLLPLAFSLVFSCLAFGHFWKFFSSSSLSFAFYNLSWSEFWLPFFGFWKRDFCNCCVFGVGTFFGDGPCISKKTLQK